MDLSETRLHQLVIAALDGDGDAYRQLLTELSTYLRRYFARRLSAVHSHHIEDLTQETLLAIHVKRMTYDPSRPFSAWLHAVARHKLVDFLRRHNLRAAISLEDDIPAPATLEADIARSDLDKVLDTLPGRTSGLIRSVKVEGASIAEAASVHGMSEGAAKVAIHRGLRALMTRFSRGNQ